MYRSIIASLLLALGAAASAEQETVVLKPQMRVTDRQWDFFSRIPCERLHEVEAQSEAEAGLLEKRRRQCLEQYRSFAPRSGVR